MKFDAFISHAGADRSKANSLCRLLERANVRCWIAQRDIPAGVDWTDAIASAIMDAAVLIVVFSRKTNSSRHVKSEIRQAFDAGKVILSIRLADVQPDGGFIHLLGSSQWINAYPGDLSDHVWRILRALAPALTRDFGSLTPPSQNRECSRWLRKSFATGALAASLILGVTSAFVASKITRPPTPPAGPEGVTAPAPDSEPQAFNLPAIPPPPNLTGDWQIQTETKTSTLSRYRGLWLVYHVGIVQDHRIVSVKGEKHREMVDGVEHTYVGPSRTRFEGQGTLDWQTGKYFLTINIREGSLSRDCVTSKFSLEIPSDTELTGIFTSDAGGQAGSTVWKRIPKQ